MKEKKYPGFGVEKSVTGWAKFLGLSYATVWRYLNDDWTPEEIATTKGLTLNMSKLQAMPKRDRDRIVEVETLVAELLDRSNYDPDGVSVSIDPKSGRLVVVWNGVSIGVYDYPKDALHLTGGDSLRIRCPLVPDPMIVRNDDGKWQLHAETKRAIFDKQFANT